MIDASNNILIDNSNKQEVAEIMNVIQKLTKQEQVNLMAYIQGFLAAKEGA